MTEIQKEVACAPEMKPRAQDKGCVHREDMKGDTEAKDSFVALDVGTLSLLVASDRKDSTPSPQLLPLQKTLSRKGSQRVGEGGRERKAAAEGEVVHPSPGNVEKPAVLVHVLGGTEACTVPNMTSPTARCRRPVGRRHPVWLDPKRVLVFFATLSSMGTLILLYFTLTMEKMAGSDANAR